MIRAEFTEIFVGQKIYWEDRIFELQQQILEHNMLHRDVLRKLDEAKKTEVIDKTTGIRTDAILKLQIIDAENLPSGTQSYVIAKQD